MLRIICAILILIYFFPIEGSSQNNRLYDSFKRGSDNYKYTYFLPDNYDTAKVYPVIIGPGEGIQKSDNSIFLDMDDPTEYGWIVVEFPIWKQNSNVVRSLMDRLRVMHKVEGNKFHILGSGANCFGHTIANPDYFHSVTGIPGNPKSKEVAQIEKLKNVKVQNIVGTKDTIWLKSAREFHELYEELGIVSTLDMIPGGGHDLNALIGQGFMERMEKLR